MAAAIPLALDGGLR